MLRIAPRSKAKSSAAVAVLAEQAHEVLAVAVDARTGGGPAGESRLAVSATISTPSAGGRCSAEQQAVVRSSTYTVAMRESKLLADVLRPTRVIVCVRRLRDPCITSRSSSALRTTMARYRPDGEIATSAAPWAPRTGHRASAACRAAPLRRRERRREACDEVRQESSSASDSPMSRCDRTQTGEPPGCADSRDLGGSADPPFELDFRDLETAAEVADVLRHPVVRLAAVARLDAAAMHFCAARDARARLRHLVDQRRRGTAPAAAPAARAPA